VNWIDTPLLVYAALEEHPAKLTVQEALQKDTWGSTVLVLVEAFQVLIRDYAMSFEDASAAAEYLARSPVQWVDLDARGALTALADRPYHRLQAADAVLLLLAEADHGTLVSQDRRLLRAAQARGIAVYNPITPGLGLAITRWEDQNLPRKGLGRFLSSTERWLRAEDAAVADRFVEATAGLTALPS
jgi:predicted nucleic acid-binding protein